MEETRTIVRYKYSKMRVFLLAIFLLAIIGALYYGGSSVYQRFFNKSDPNYVVNRVSRMIEIGEESPEVTTITDMEPLKDQAFFRDARVGDMVLIYSNAKKAVLYRVETGKILGVAPISL